MKYYLSSICALKRLEIPAVYHIRSDELYELDEAAFGFLKKCATLEGCRADGYTEFVRYAVHEGILVTDRIDVKRPLIKKSPEPSLRYLEVQVTLRCNLTCRHCYIGTPEDVELTPEEVVQILMEFEEMQGLRLLITGGEPLLHRKFHDINNLLPDFAFRKILFTNGILLSKRVLKSLNVDEIQISIDGLESRHDALRGKGSFKKAMSAVEMALDSGFDVSIATMVHSMNLDDFDRMERLFKDLGIKDWSVDVPCLEGNVLNNPSLLLSPEIGGNYLRYGFGEGLHAGEGGFACGLHLASVTAEGNVAKCAFYMSSPVGHIDEGLDTCWSRIAPVRLEELECNCSLKEVCRGGCRYRAGLLGNRLGKDLYRCFAYI